MARRVEDLEVWKRAEAFCDAVIAILDRPGFRSDLRMHSQLQDAVDSILSNMSEGFSQPTDRAFARYLRYAQGSLAESRTRLGRAAKRRYISAEEYKTRDDLGDEVARMLTGLIKYLLRSNRRDRGLGRPDTTDDG